MVHELFLTLFLSFSLFRILAGFNKDSPEDRLLLLKIALKCADISHTAKSSEMHFKWTERITREFHKQVRTFSLSFSRSPVLSFSR